LCEKCDGLTTIWYLKKHKNCWNCTVMVMKKCQLRKQSMFLWAK
jgi:L-rhamnose mutarotase